MVSVMLAILFVVLALKPSSMILPNCYHFFLNFMLAILAHRIRYALMSYAVPIYRAYANCVIFLLKTKENKKIELGKSAY